MNDSTTFADILARAGLSDYSGYFTDPSSQFGFTTQQAEQFSKFFRPFDTARLEEAAKEIDQRQATRTGFLQSDYQSGFRGLTREFGQATRQLGQDAGQAGFTRAGTTARQMSNLRSQTRETMEDLMLGRQRGMFQIEQQAGQERAALTRTLQDYLNRVYGRAFDIFRLDPGTPVTQGGGGGTRGAPGTAGGAGYEDEDEDFYPGGDV
jgi:hypothetical protein